MIKVTTSNVQEVKADIMKAIREFTDSGFVTIGIHESAGAHQNKNKKDDDISNARLGAILHYGTNDGHIPARPWLDVGVDKGIQEYLNILLLDVQNGATLEEALLEIGSEAVGNVQEWMKELSTPANAESTIARKKGNDNPLIDTGNLRQSVTSKVSITEPQEGGL